MPVPPEDSYTRLLNTFGGVAGIAAVAAALVYGTGALVLMLRLGLRRLPSTTAVPQLPREFLLSVGLQIVVPAVLVGGVVVLASRRWRWAAIAALAVYLVIGGYLIAKAPFPAKACLAGGGDVVGVLIGESANRTYLGDLSNRHPRRILTIPAARIDTLLVGGREAQIEGVACPRG